MREPLIRIQKRKFGNSELVIMPVEGGSTLSVGAAIVAGGALWKLSLAVSVKEQDEKLITPDEKLVGGEPSPPKQVSGMIPPGP
jgi:hypothetical protein